MFCFFVFPRFQLVAVLQKVDGGEPSAMVEKVSDTQECVHAASRVNRREGGGEEGGGGSSSNSIVIFIAMARENAKVECADL